MKKLIYKIHVRYMDVIDHIEVRKRLVTFSDDPSML